MSDATFQLLTSSGFLTAVAIGAVGVVIVLVWALVARGPSPVGGVILVAGIVIAMSREETLPSGLLIGLGLLVLVGIIPVRSPLVIMAIVVPGAVVVATAQISDARSVSVWLVVVAIVLLAPVVASFDRRFASNALATPLLAISIGSVFLTVPDTEFAVLAAGASFAWVVAGPPAKLARLGSSGSLVGVGLLVWLVATGGSAQPLVLLAGIATLGVLIIEPVVAALRDPSQRREAEAPTADGGTAAVLVAAHIAIQALIAIVIRV